MPDPFKIVHLIKPDKFIQPFVDFVDKNLSLKGHVFFVFGSSKKYAIQKRKNIYFINTPLDYVITFPRLVLACKSAKKIILHGLFWKVVAFFFLFRSFPSKSYWIIWGGDLYIYKARKATLRNKIYEFLRKSVIKKIGYIVTSLDGEYRLVRKWYKLKTEYIKMFVYPSVVYKPIISNTKRNKKMMILLGNSSTQTNRHMEALEIISKKNEANSEFLVFCPLSYGDMKYRDLVIKRGIFLLKDKFIPMTDFIPLETYNKFLSTMDVAIFNNDRQQAMGNIITLLGMGKKIFMPAKSPVAKHLKKLGVRVFDIIEFSFDSNFPERKNNIGVIKKNYSEQKLISNLIALFNN